MERVLNVAGQKFHGQIQKSGKQFNRPSMGTKLIGDHDSSIQTIGTLDESCVSHVEHYRAGVQLNSQNQEKESHQNVLEQAFSSSIERDQEIVRLQKKMCKLQHRIGKLQKRVEHLQNL